MRLSDVAEGTKFIFGYDIIHKDDTKSDKGGKLFFNIFRGLGMLPLVGFFVNVGMTAYLVKTVPPQDRKVVALFFGIRTAASLAGPLLAPVDLGFSLWKAKHPPY